jgi:hypothetical protein
MKYAIMVKMIGSVVLGCIMIVLAGCIEIQEEITIYPDGSGKVQQDQLWTKQALDSIQKVSKRDEENLRHQVEKQNATRFDFVVDTEIQKEEDRYSVTQTGYFEDISKPFGGIVTLQEKGDGSFALRFKQPKEEKTEWFKMIKGKKLPEGLKVTLVFVVPGEITKAKGFDSFKGRKAKLVLDSERIKKIFKGPLDILFKAPTEKIEEEFDDFKDEYEEEYELFLNRMKTAISKTKANLTILRTAIEAYAAENNGRYPGKKLQELTPNYLLEIPEEGIRGKKQSCQQTRWERGLILGPRGKDNRA